MRMALRLIHEGDPTGAVPDSPELASLESELLFSCYVAPFLSSEVFTVINSSDVVCRSVLGHGPVDRRRAGED
jgi:hypothetical protein